MSLGSKREWKAPFCRWGIVGGKMKLQGPSSPSDSLLSNCLITTFVLVSSFLLRVSHAGHGRGGLRKKKAKKKEKEN